MKYFKTIRARFALWTAGFLFAALTLFGSFVYFNMQRNLVAAVDETLRLTSSQLVAEIDLRREKPYIDENPLIETDFGWLRKQGLTTRLLTLEKVAVHTYGPYQDELPEPRLVITHTEPITNTPSSNLPHEFQTILIPGSPEHLRVYTLLVVKEGIDIGILQVAQNLNNVNDTLNLLLTTLLIGVPLTMLIAGGGGYFLAARALAPLSKMTNTARYISTQNLSERLNLPKREDELGDLAATFDLMLTRLDQGFRRERQFTADASHELRTPLSAIQTIISGTLSRPRSVVEYERALRDLDDEAKRMRILTEGLLDLARHDATRNAAKIEPVDVATLLRDVADSLMPMAEEKGLTILKHLPNDTLIVRGDCDGLIRLFVNLLHNAIKYTEQGSITLSAMRKDKQQVVVTVCDTGIGIAPEHLPYIFDRFYQADKSRSGKGMGLGLAIAHNIAQAHHGDITVESLPGKGATFTVTLTTQ